MTVLELVHVDYLIFAFMILGTLSSSISGAMRGIESNMDITGVLLLAFVNGNGGGTLRDIILNQTLFWIKQPMYIWLSIIVGSISFLAIYYKDRLIQSNTLHSALIFTDALGLGAFSIAGAEKTLSLGLGNTLALVMGMLTATGGGIVADIIANRVPLVFSKELYITVAFTGILLFISLTTLHLDITIAAIISMLFMISLRLYSVKIKWTLPKIHLKFRSHDKK